MKNILDHQGIGTLVNLSGNLKDATLQITSNFHSSYGTATDIVKELFNINGHNRSILGESLNDNTEINRDIIANDDGHNTIDIENELNSIVINYINNYITYLLDNISKRGFPNKLKAITIKLLSVSLFTDYPELIIPQEYKNLVGNYIDLPNRNKDFYLSTIDEIRLVDPNSKLINKLDELGNSLFSYELHDIHEYRYASADIKEIFKNSSDEYFRIISPNIRELRTIIGLEHTTYNDNINKSLTELNSMIDNEELMSKLNNLIL